MEKVRLKEIIRELGLSACKSTGVWYCNMDCMACTSKKLGISEEEYKEIFVTPKVTNEKAKLCTSDEYFRCMAVDPKECSQMECEVCRMRGWNLTEEEYEIIFKDYYSF
jgi:hypothetical protein